MDRRILDLFVDSLCEVMVQMPSRVKITDSQIEDTETKVVVKTLINNNWHIWIPHPKDGGGFNFYLESEQIGKLKRAIVEREERELVKIHDVMYNEGDNIWIKLEDIQKMRKTTPMIEEAIQNLLTVYALNVDSDKK